MGFPEADRGDGGGGILFPEEERGGGSVVSCLVLLGELLSEVGCSSVFLVGFGEDSFSLGPPVSAGLDGLDFFELMICEAGSMSDFAGFVEV